MFGKRTIAAIGFSLLPISSVRAEFQICNDLGTTLKVALVLVDDRDRAAIIAPKEGGWLYPEKTSVTYTVRGWWRIPQGRCARLDFTGLVWAVRWEPWNFDVGATDAWPKFSVRDQDFEIHRADMQPAGSRFEAFDIFDDNFPSAGGGPKVVTRIFREGGSGTTWD